MTQIITIELGDDIAAALMDQDGILPSGAAMQLDIPFIAKRVQAILLHSVTRNLDPIPERAMTLLRDIAIERATRAAGQPGSDGRSIRRHADEILEWILTG